MWMNLHALPVGKSMFTVYVTTDPKGTPRDECEADEVDVVAPRSAWSTDDVLEGTVHPRGEDAREYIKDLYGDDARVIGIVNQSDGFVFYDAFAAGEA